MMGSDLSTEILLVVSAALRAIPPEVGSDIYVISFYVCDDEDDPRRPTLTVGFNTESHYRESIPIASGEAEARWNYAFWLQNQLVVFGAKVSAAIVESWEKDSGLWYSDAEEDEDFDRCMEIGGRITSNFVSIVCGVAARLHDSGFLKSLLARSIPIVIHELEYYHQIADQTERANPPGLADDFVVWVRSLYDRH